MTLRRLGILVVALLVAIALAMTNPTIEEYLRFVELRLGAALDRIDQPDREKTMIQAVFRSQGKRLIEGIVRPATKRQNWGLWSVYRTNVLDTEVVAGWHSEPCGFYILGGGLEAFLWITCSQRLEIALQAWVIRYHQVVLRFNSSNPNILFDNVF
jgi:Domain of unknown function (DUF4359)